ncbi:hypothetical protein IM511_09375 [Erythrobacteraceae bacterium E2-1 Yellow Sea]|nr:hypothetical protein [Erythrobacteraceae bacterium E2-1 Yellow Sea]
MMRAFWPLFLFAIAVVAAGLQLDRQSRISPDWSGLVPPPFRSFSQSQITADALPQGTPAQAVHEAERLVRLRPMEAAHLRMLAQAQFVANQEGVGVQTLQIAGRLGWRDMATQHAMLRLALAAGDDAEATRRLAAIWALSDDRAEIAPIATAVLTRKTAQVEFVRLLKVEPRWRAKIIREAPLILPPHLAQAISPDQ